MSDRRIPSFYETLRAKALRVTKKEQTLRAKALRVTKKRGRVTKEKASG